MAASTGAPTALVFAALVWGAAAPAAAATPARPSFVEHPCDLPDIEPEVAGRLRCGTVAVVRDARAPEHGTFELAVVVVRSARQPALPDPVVYISGGPGGPLTVFTEHQAEHPYAPDRDLVLVDQRGMGRSEPGLCPNLRDTLAEALMAVATDPGAASIERRRAGFAACHAEIVAEGIDLADFGTPVTVEDFETVRQALGIARWNVVGESYGTTVAMTLMALHPESIRAAVLDSVNPPDPILPAWSRNVEEARDAFFASCAADPACATAYPDLAGTYRATLARLRATPMALPAGPLTAALFESVVGHLVYYPGYYAGLPRLIASVYDGETNLFVIALAALAAPLHDPARGVGFAANAAVDCRDRPRLRDTLAPDADVFDETLLYGVCPSWSALGPPPLVPTGTAVPTLVLAGQFDPNARPAASRGLADTIGARARWVEFPLVGHNVRAFSPCAGTIVAAFIDHPDRPLDTGCASRPEPIAFLPPRRTP